jgi:D-xylose 1-dehydrogenase (NADP+, D-xylono-1,5-lactone-forming)
MIRFGILGAGRILLKYGPAFALTKGTQLVAIASRDFERARTAATQHGAQRAHAGYEALLADPEVDVVVNALHNGLHCEWTIRALEAGKHVLCEKPLACSSAEVERMYSAAHKCRRWLMEGFMYRFHPQIEEAHRLVAEGEIGRVVYVHSRFAGHSRDRQNPRFWPDAGGGSLMDMGCYCVNFSRLFAGEPQRGEGHARFENGVDVTMAGQFACADGAAASFFCGFESEGIFAAEIIGTKGRLTIPHPWLPPASPAELILTRERHSESILVEALPPPSGHFALEMEHFATCVRENRAPQFPPGVDAERDSRGNMRAIEMLLDSARH